LLPGAGTALTALRALGYRLIVVSNQSGVARGMFDEAAVQAVNDEMSRQLQKLAGATIDASYYCPYHPEAVIQEYRADHEWRKPKPGMLKAAAEKFQLDLAQCWMIGDMARDIEAGAAAGCRTILLRDLDRKPSAAAEKLTVTPNFVVKTLADAARIIAREGRNPPPAHPMAKQEPRPVKPQTTVAELPAAPAPPAPPTQPHTVVNGEPRAHAHSDRPAASHVPRAGATADPLERQIEELVIQLRQQNRNAEMIGDFSVSKFAALVLQFLTAAALIVGLAKLFTQKVSYATYADIEMAVLGNLTAVTWVLVAVVLQGAVIALLVYSRQKQ